MLHLRDIVRVSNAGVHRASLGRDLLASAKLVIKDKTSATDGGDVPFSSATEETPGPLCFNCKEPVTVPCWYCTDCEAGECPPSSTQCMSLIFEQRSIPLRRLREELVPCCDPRQQRCLDVAIATAQVLPPHQDTPGQSTRSESQFFGCSPLDVSLVARACQNPAKDRALRPPHG